MYKISAWDDWSSVIVVVYFVITCLKGVDIEAVCVEKIGQFARAVHIDRFGEAELVADLKKPLDHFKRCKTLIWIFESSHKGKAIFQAAGLARPASD